jgi:hemerythrin-like domain-containing protein
MQAQKGNSTEEDEMEPTGEQYLRGLREDHARFARVLSMIGRDAQRLLDEPDAVLPLFSEAVDYVVNYQNVHHHPREEIMFAKVAGASETLADTSAHLTHEHELADRAGEELLAALDRASHSSRRSTRQELARQLERFAHSMRGHIAQEEEILYSEAWDTLSPADWDDLAASVPDPLDRDQDDRYPLLADYVSGGRTHSTVQLDSSPLGEAVESGLEQLSAVTRRLGAVTATARRQQREACDLTLESVRDMPNTPMRQPRKTLSASGQNARAFTAAYGRWLREWRDVLASGGRDLHA